MPLRPATLPPRGAVIDLVYVSGGTPLVRRARQLGLRCVDGWAVLLAQGAAAFQAWTGRPAPVEAMRQALARLGDTATPQQIQEWIEQELKMHIPKNMVSAYKSTILRRNSGISAFMRPRPAGSANNLGGGNSN